MILNKFRYINENNFKNLSTVWFVAISSSLLIYFICVLVVCFGRNDFYDFWHPQERMEEFKENVILFLCMKTFEINRHIFKTAFLPKKCK